MNAAASQAASLAGIHPASWWSMAQLAAQDYFTRLQASGLSAFPHPAELAAAFPGGLGAMAATGNSSSSSSRQNNGGDAKGKGRKEKKSTGNNNSAQNSAMSNASSSGRAASSPSSYKQSSYKSSASNQYSPATLHKELLAMQAAAVAAGNMG